MADLPVGANKVFTIPASEETKLVFDPGIQHLTIRNISLSNKIFLRIDGVDAVIDNDENYFIDAIIAGLELYSRKSFTEVSLITSAEQEVMIINAY